MDKDHAESTPSALYKRKTINDKLYKLWLK